MDVQTFYAAAALTIPALSCGRDATRLLLCHPSLWGARGDLARAWRGRADIHTVHVLGAPGVVHVDVAGCGEQELKRLERLQRPILATTPPPCVCYGTLRVAAEHGLRKAARRLKKQLLTPGLFWEAAAKGDLSVMRFMRACDVRGLRWGLDCRLALVMAPDEAREVILDMFPKHACPYTVAQYGRPGRLLAMDPKRLCRMTTWALAQRGCVDEVVELFRRGAPCGPEVAEDFAVAGRVDDACRLRDAGLHVAGCVFRVLSRGRDDCERVAEQLVDLGFPVDCNGVRELMRRGLHCVVARSTIHWDHHYSDDAWFICEAHKAGRGDIVEKLVATIRARKSHYTQGVVRGLVSCSRLELLERCALGELPVCHSDTWQMLETLVENDMHEAVRAYVRAEHGARLLLRAIQASSQPLVRALKDAGVALAPQHMFEATLRSRDTPQSDQVATLVNGWAEDVGLGCMYIHSTSANTVSVGFTLLASSGIRIQRTSVNTMTVLDAGMWPVFSG